VPSRTCLLICSAFLLESGPQMIRKIGGIRYHRVVVAGQINHLKIRAYSQPSFSIIGKVISILRWRKINYTYCKGRRKVFGVCKSQCIFDTHGVGACNLSEYCLSNGFGSSVHGAPSAGLKNPKSSLMGGNHKSSRLVFCPSPLL